MLRENDSLGGKERLQFIKLVFHSPIIIDFVNFRAMLYPGQHVKNDFRITLNYEFRKVGCDCHEETIQKTFQFCCVVGFMANVTMVDLQDSTLGRSENASKT